MSDDGPGIPPEELPHLAERHFRGARSRGVEGSGLGLFIVRAVVEAHGGALRVTSGVGRGTTVTVTLPFAAVARSRRRRRGRMRRQAVDAYRRSAAQAG